MLITLRVCNSRSRDIVRLPPRSTKPFVRAIVACFLASLAVIAGALWKWGAAEVRGQVGEVCGLSLLGTIWMAIGTQVFPWLGLALGDDALERRNSAALAGMGGGMMALGLIYAGGSLGEGPSYWNNIFSAGLGTAGLFALWLLLELGGRVSVSIAEERDLASGIRLCGFLMAAGVILARAVAGDWHSESATIRDFLRDGWPAATLCLGAIVIEWLVRPTRIVPFPAWPSCGLLPALAYLAAAIAWVGRLGWWEGMPR